MKQHDGKMRGGERIMGGLVLVAGMLAAGGLLVPHEARAGDTKFDSDSLGNLSARAIGPAVMGGRIAAIDAYAGDKVTVYVGAASGGVWKSDNGGLTFKPVFEDYVQSIGAVRVDPSNPKTVWVGTGESWARNSVSVGTGVYKTTDSGDNWQLMGLADTEHIGRILVNPTDGNTVYVCALGHLWNSNAERGVFRTKDAGKTWKRVFFVNEDTGCADLAADPQDPNILYAGMWQVRRYPWKFISGGPGSGVFRSTDGGETWKPIRKGLPEGDLGRIGIAAAPSRGSTIYAVVEAKETALYRSDDLGENWTKMNTSFNVQGRPFYFAYLVVDPTDYQRVYKPGYGLTVSDDGGKTFGAVGGGGGGIGGGGYHGDLHALWINPKNSYDLLLGTDGGVFASSDRGAHWRMLAALPVSQFYHVTYDMQLPYNIYGGLQDNGTWTGPSKHTDGIPNRAWRNIAFGDGFSAQVDQSDPDYVYVEFQGGHVSRYRLSNSESKNIRPFPKHGEPELRFNWNTPLLTRPGRTGTLYIGSQYLYRSTDRGDSWVRISPDLTTNNPAKQKQEESGGLTVDNSDAEKHCTIYTISESPKNPNVIWVGTDDGNVQVTRDAGKSWTNVTKNLPGIPEATWVSTVEAGHFDQGTAYASLDGHQTGDMKTYLARTRDFGKTWESLSTPDLVGYAHVIREDLVNPSLLFAGTEMGLFISVDGGKSWGKLTSGIPKSVPVRDLAIHPHENDLIVATHGRGIYIVDDLTPLRALSPEVLDKDFALLPSRSGVETLSTFEQRSDGDGEFTGDSGRDAARIVYYLKKRMLVGEFKAGVYDSKGDLVEELSTSRRKGLNVLEWSMRMKPPKTPPATSLVPDPYTFIGPHVPDGPYTVKVTRGKETTTAEVHVIPDPRAKHTAADRAEQHKTAFEAYHLVEHIAFVVDAVADLGAQALDRAGRLSSNDTLRKRLETLRDSLAATQKNLAATREGGFTGEIKLREKILEVYGGVNGYAGRPTESQVSQLAALRKELDGVEADFHAAAEKEVAAANPELEKKKLPALKLLSEDDWRKRDQKQGSEMMALDLDIRGQGLQALFFLRIR
jgi:photosystem II stability/assembly factor-like uncharacterized protein